ncbi:MAG: metal ABC transporter substrate-binding protein, partial [Anaerolineales bacterium]|nr:metal ABC transporter substrate-binding protein [Anaerolineales bacterium]
SDTNAEVIVVSEGIMPLKIGENLGVDQDDDHQIHSGEDPHVWFDPNNIMIWTENISRVLGRIDSPNAESYQANAETYRNELLELDTWIREQIELIPPENRELVTDHTLLGYFAEEYDFTQIGAVIPAMTTEAETSGQQLAELIDIIREHQTRAIFVGVDFDPTLIQRVADETGVDLISLYFGSLTAGSPADTYLTFMQYNVEAIVSALK